MARPNTNPDRDDTPPPPPTPIVLWGAIGERYKALGGTKWGYPVHNEQATPDGRGRYVHFRNHPQNVATMSIYWSPQTGAHEIFGLIRQGWSSYGWERSLLGYPTSGEMPTHDGVGRWQTFEGGQYIWHPDTGAFEVHGDILARYGQLGGSAWGYPITDEKSTPDGRGRFNHFREVATGAEKSIYWTPETGAHEVFGYIRQAWASLRWERSVLGYPTSGELDTHDKEGRWQTFEGGIYVWHPKTGAFEVHGDILARYGQLGGSAWGYPTTNEGNAKGPGRFNHFIHLPSGEERSIYWTPNTGAVEVYGDIHWRWKKLGWEWSHLGYPVSPETDWPEGGAGSRQQKFQGGRIIWQASDRATGADPMIVGKNLKGGQGFGGNANMRLHSDGKVDFFGEVTNGAYQDYDYSIYALARTPKLALAMRKSGQINMQVFGRNENDWGESVHNEAVRSNFFEFQNATFEVHTNHEGGVTGVIDDILSTVLSWAVTGALGPGIIGLIYAGIELGAVATGGSWNAGPRIIAGSLWMLGPEGYLVSMAVDSLARIGIESRALNADERTLLRIIFEDQIDLDVITVTDTAGMSGRKFVFPSPMPDTSVNMNLGDRYKQNPDFSTKSYPKLLAHEATHAWQYKHMANPSSYILHGIFDSEYEPGSLGKPWKKYNIEQQATIVERWVDDHYTPGQPANDYGLSSPGALTDTKFQYIAKHIRVGRS